MRFSDASNNTPPMNILLTGFGPFPGAPFNPTVPLVATLGRSRRLALADIRPTSHIFRTSYQAVDRDLPILLARTRPDVLLMFGLAGRSRHLRVETRARNILSRMIPDATGRRPTAGVIAPGAEAALPLRAAAQRLVQAARSTGAKAAPSRDAGRYLCNYLCWRAAEAAARDGGPKIAAFVHIPLVQTRGNRRRAPLTFRQLVQASEAIMCAAIAAARTAE
jgi:pyroglutamyl-peptidase